MGGKSKQSQRTKNNVKPSSSSRSAALLKNTAEGNQCANLFLNSVQSVDNTLKSEFLLCFKRINKKDPITKTKGLQDLTNAVETSDVEDVVRMLPSWAQWYKSASVEPEHKVRECAQLCHSAVMRKCGRRAAPVLRAVAPVWLLACHDEFAPAAAAADRALRDTFPDRKLREAISFCKSEIMDYLTANILAYADRRLPESERVAACSLLALGRVASVEGVGEELGSLLQRDSFWRLATHAEGRLRAAWFAAVAEAASRVDFSETVARRGARAALASRTLDASAWLCLFELMQRVPKWHEWLDDKDLLLQRLLQLIENGGWGDARRLVDALPMFTGGPGASRQALVEALFKGLRTKGVLISKRERNAWVDGIVDLLRDASPDELRAVIGRDSLFAVALESSDAPHWEDFVRYVGERSAALLRHWLRSDRVSVVADFCSDIVASTKEQLERASDPGELDRLVDGHMLFLRTLQTATAASDAKFRSVKFENDPQPEKSSSIVAEADSPKEKSYECAVEEAGEGVFGEYVVLVDSSPSAKGRREVVKGVKALLRLFDRERLLRAAMRRLGAECVSALAERALRQWDLGPDGVELAFAVLEHAGAEERDALVRLSAEASAERCLQFCLPLARADADSAAARWLRDAACTRVLRALCARALHDAAPLEHYELLMDALSQPASVISDATVSEVVCEVVAAGADGAAVAERICGALRDRPEAQDTLLRHLIALAFSRPDTPWRCAVELSAVPAARRALLLRVAAECAKGAARVAPDAVAMERVAAVCSQLLAASDAAEVVAFTRALLATPAAETPLRQFALRQDCILGELHCPLEEESPSEGAELTRDELVRQADAMLFRAIYLQRVDGLAPLADAYMRRQFLESVHDFAVIHSLCETYGFWEHHALIEEYHTRLQSIVAESVGRASREGRRALLGAASQLAAGEGFYWAYAARHLRDALPPSEELDVDLDSLRSSVTGNGYFHSLQALTRGSADGEEVLRCRLALMQRSLCASGLAAADAEPDLELAVKAHPASGELRCDWRTLSWADCVRCASTLRAAAAAVSVRGWLLPPHHWDFVALSLADALQAAERQARHRTDVKVAMLWLAAEDLLGAVVRFVRSVPRECERRVPPAHVAQLPAEWAAVFEPAVRASVLAVVTLLLREEAVGSAAAAFAAAAVRAARWVRVADVEEASALAAAAAAALERGPPRVTLYLAYGALLMSADALVRRDEDRFLSWKQRRIRACERGEGGEEAAPEASWWEVYEAPLQRLHELAEAALGELRAGEQTGEMAPHHDSHRVALAYLLASRAALATLALVAERCERGERDLLAHHLRRLADGGFADGLLSVCLRLLPADVVECASALPPDKEALFDATQTEEAEAAAKRASAQEVGALACRCLGAAVGGALAAAVRSWRSVAPERAARALSRVVRAALSARLIREQLSELRRHADADVAVDEAAREVRCTADEGTLRVHFAREHPLVAPRVDGPASLALATRAAELHLAAGGRVSGALRVWRSAAASPSGGASCYVCYCRLHPQSGLEPQSQCRQCRSPFHGQCLNAWFLTTSKCSCPVCRITF